jgi:uncharacterized protein YndB with AHSA1/START domain
MSNLEQYAPGPASGAQVRKDGENWTLIVVRELRHPPAMVWEALTDPAHLSAWAPFDADRNLADEGPVKLSMVGTPKPQVFESAVKRAEAPRLLEYSWGAKTSGGSSRRSAAARASRCGTTSIVASSRGARPAGISASMCLSGSSQVNRWDASSAPTP